MSRAVGLALLLIGGAFLYQINRTVKINPVKQLDSYGEPEPELSIFNEVSEQVHDFMYDTVKEGNYTMQHFTPEEFREWWEFMDVDLVKRLDMFRERWGAPVRISPVNGALGRHGGGSKSYHNIDRYKKVRGIDVFPKGLTAANAPLAVQIAEECGFGGIGVYTDTMPSMMMHLDNRSGRGRWSRINKKYKAIELAYA